MVRLSAPESLQQLLRVMVCGSIRELQAVFWLLAFMCVVACLFIRKQHLSFVVKSVPRHHVLVRGCVLTGLGYFVAVCLLRLFTKFDDFGYRLLYPGTFMLMIAVVVTSCERYQIDAYRTFNAIPKIWAWGFMTLLIVIGSQVITIENLLRKWANVSVLETRPAFCLLENAIERKFEEIPSGSLVFVSSYVADDYMANFIRPDLIVIPYRYGAYGEQIRPPHSHVGVFVEQSVPASFGMSFFGESGGGVPCGHFRKVTLGGLEGAGLKQNEMQ